MVDENGTFGAGCCKPQDVVAGGMTRYHSRGCSSAEDAGAEGDHPAAIKRFSFARSRYSSSIGVARRVCPQDSDIRSGSIQAAEWRTAREVLASLAHWQSLRTQVFDQTRAAVGAWRDTAANTPALLVKSVCRDAIDRVGSTALRFAVGRRRRSGSADCEIARSSERCICDLRGFWSVD